MKALHFVVVVCFGLAYLVYALGASPYVAAAIGALALVLELVAWIVWWTRFVNGERD